MDSPVDNEGSMLGSHRANMNHHEMIRLLEKLEELWDACEQINDTAAGQGAVDVALIPWSCRHTTVAHCLHTHRR